MNKVKFLSIFLISLIISCTDSENPDDDITVSTSDLTITVDEIPSVGQSIGTVEGTTNQGSVTFSITENPNEVLQINPSTGELTVQNPIDVFENPIVFGIVRVENGDVFKNAIVIVNLVLPCDSNQTPLLQAYYPMNSNAMDQSGFNNHGVVIGPTLANDRFSIAESAYYFDGIDDKIEVPDSEQLFLNNEFTISAWIYPEEIKTQEIIRKGNNVNGPSALPYGLALSATNDIVFSITTSDGVLTQARMHGYSINKWYLITGILKDQKMYLYVNDYLASVKSIHGEIFDDSLPLLIGTRLSLPSSTFKGIIDDVRIYNSALCTEEVINLYNN
ncbi:LamG-like jellyroll fold domain-containing protein [Flavobacterium sp.]|uniref:LamG-like jellyroll fold domain-containing protein n=1 Tax=Flavobacterium sp. TaxID=239 RepID=UPI002623FA60|nr:LamG-like jellyroll fold domain-containing protein [Flavobacterium sp.]